MKKEIQIEITSKCSLNCIHCSALALRSNQFPEKISPTRIANLMGSLSMDAHIYFTGGEPLIASNLDDYCYEINKATDKTTFGLFTSGIISDGSSYQCVSKERAAALKSLGITDCYISLYGTKASTHNLITGYDSFEMTCQAIENLHSAGIQVRSHVVLNRHNVDHIDDFFVFAEERGIESIRILHLVKAGMAVHSWENIGISLKKQIEGINEAIITAKKHPKVSLSVSGFPEIMPCRPDASSEGCQRGSSVLFITFDGEIYPCACAKYLKELMLGTLDDIPGVIDSIKTYEARPCYQKCLNEI